ncbi:MAG TPA: hypothetical protein VLL52_20310 [Anaerolineae bacterium]|nr:hypothetical protein [Anaerolineae bacterium]
MSGDMLSDDMSGNGAGFEEMDWTEAGAEADENLAELFEEVKTWSGVLAGGEKLSAEASAVDDLWKSEISFGDPRSRLQAVTKGSLAAKGVELSAEMQAQMDLWDFYTLTLRVDMKPKPGAHFRQLLCRFHLNPDDDQGAVVQAMFPEEAWMPVLSWGGQFGLGIGAGLGWQGIVEPVDLAVVEGLGASVAGRIVNREEAKAQIALAPFEYTGGRFTIVANGVDNERAYWRIEGEELTQTTSMLFALLLKVPKGQETLAFKAEAWAEPDMTWLVNSVRNVARDLTDRLLGLLKLKQKAALKFGLYAGEKWVLTLPRESGE